MSLTRCALNKGGNVYVIFQIVWRVNGEMLHLTCTVQVHYLNQSVQEVILSGCSHCIVKTELGGRMEGLQMKYCLVKPLFY